MSGSPPILSIIGRKNSGKTTLLVALCAELGRRGRRVATLKHGHHGFDIDHPGTDSWRHFNEGGAQAVAVVAADRVAMVMRTASEEEPAALVERLFSGRGYDLVLVEGYKHGPFPKIEIFRRAVHEAPIADPEDHAGCALHLAFVTDLPALEAVRPVIPLDAEGGTAHVAAVADLVEAWLASSDARAGEVG